MKPNNEFTTVISLGHKDIMHLTFFFCFPFNFVKKKKVSFSSDKNIHFDPHYIYI